MKSPTELSNQLARQWENPSLREDRLLGDGGWPLQLSIGRPTGGEIARDWASVVKHVRNWRSVDTGLVIWDSVCYRATGEAFEIPLFWKITNAREWTKATANQAIRSEFASLEQIIKACDPLFHSMFVRQRSLWKGKPLREICKAAELATLLEPGCAHGAPLRALSLAGIDTKFFERHRGLITRLIDLRFDGEATRQGLETFLNAWQDDHWLLVVDLDGGLLPFSQLRVRSSELLNSHLTACNIIVVENERCVHLLPKRLSGTIGVLGAGNNLQWLSAPWIQRARVAYWGDIDTWGLNMLATARSKIPQVSALLMSRHIFDKYATAHAVTESVTSNIHFPESLESHEIDLYRHLLTLEKARLEQEYIHQDDVYFSIDEWARQSHVD